MKLSVIIPAYNTAEYLRECVDSVKICDGVEIILVDDGSSDGVTPSLCDELASERSDIKAVHSPNKGLGGARNLGLTYACGDYVLFLDSDDLLADGAVDALLEATEHGDDVIAFGFFVRNGNADTAYTPNICLPNGRFSVRSNPECLLSLPSAWSRAWKRSFLTASEITFPEKLRYEDLATVPALLAAAKTIYPLQKELYIYRIRRGSIMSDSSPQKNKDVLAAFDLLLSSFDRLGLTEAYKNELERLAVDHILIAASVRVLSGREKSAREAVRKLVRYVDLHFPTLEKNPHLKSLSFKHRLVFSLVRNDHIRLAQFCIRIHNLIS